MSDKQTNFQTFVDNDVPKIQITTTKVFDVNTDRFDELNKKLEDLAAELEQKDKEWKKERIEIEKKSK